MTRFRGGQPQGNRQLPPPSDLEVVTFALGSDEFAVISFSMPDHELPEGLTQAEREVTRGVLEGRSNAEIAEKRGCSPHTVANQLRSIYSKLGISGRAALIRCCTQARDDLPLAGE